MGQRVQTVVVISGPGGVGKGTIVHGVMARHGDDRILSLARSATTRSPRPGEMDRVHYDFMTPDAFTALVEQEGFLEWATFGDHRYGTPRSVVDDSDCPILILEIDCQGFDQLRRHPERLGGAALHSIFIAPPSWEALEARLIGRDGADDPRIQQRLAIGKEEMDKRHDYDHIVINDDVQEAIETVDGILLKLL